MELKTVGLPISHKENERRRTLVPADIEVIRHPEQIYIEDGYGDVLGYSNDDYSCQGVKIANRLEVLSKDIVADPKVGDAEYLGHCFWRNNEIAGEAAVFHAYMCHGVFPYNTKAAVLGRGNIARGAVKTLNFMGAEVMQYDRKTENLFRQELGRYDVVVNAILWDTTRHDHIIYREDLKRMKHGAMIIDVSCDRNGGVETSIPTTIENPTYVIDGVTHYVVDHTPSLFWKTATETLSAEFVKYIDFLIENRPLENPVLKLCHNFEKGVILDHRIIEFQGRE